MSQFLIRLLGDRPLRTIIKLLILSAIIGMVLTGRGWTPLDVPERLWYFVIEIVNFFYASFGRMLDALLVGMMIVVPIFIIRCLLKKRKS